MGVTKFISRNPPTWICLKDSKLITFCVQNSLTAVETVKVEQSIAEEERLLYEQSDLKIEVIELTRLAAIKVGAWGTTPAALIALSEDGKVHGAHLVKACLKFDPAYFVFPECSQNVPPNHKNRSHVTFS